MTIGLGVSLYSYQQSQFFRELDLEAQLREVGENLPGADGIEIIDEMSLRYPDPGEAFRQRWFGWMERYGTRPISMDVSMDVLQFRDHVMTHDECAERLAHDLRLAKSLGFRNVRVLSTCPLAVMLKALPVAEALDVRLGKEIHQPMVLDGPEVSEILDVIARTGTRHLGIVPDLGIFQFRLSSVQLGFFARRGASPDACAATDTLCDRLRSGDAPFALFDMARHTAGNLRGAFRRFLQTGTAEADFVDAFAGVKRFAEAHVTDPTPLDYGVVAEALMLSRTDPDRLRAIAGHVTGVHGKFNYMAPDPVRPGAYHEPSIDYPAAIRALRDGGFDGYVNSEYEGQRYLQDRTRADMMDEVDQVRRHQSMMRDLLTA